VKLVPGREAQGGVAGVIGIEGGVVSGVINLESSGVGAAVRPRLRANMAYRDRTAWLRMQSETKRSLPAICDLQGDFQKLQGEPMLLPVQFANGFKILERLLPN